MRYTEKDISKSYSFFLCKSNSDLDRKEVGFSEQLVANERGLCFTEIKEKQL